MGLLIMPVRDRSFEQVFWWACSWYVFWCCLLVTGLLMLSTHDKSFGVVFSWQVFWCLVVTGPFCDVCSWQGFLMLPAAHDRSFDDAFSRQVFCWCLLATGLLVLPARDKSFNDLHEFTRVYCHSSRSQGHIGYTRDSSPTIIKNVLQGPSSSICHKITFKRRCM